MSHFSSFEIRFALKGINTLYYRETGKLFATLAVIEQFYFRFLEEPSIPEETEYCLNSCLIKNEKRSPNYFLCLHIIVHIINIWLL